MGSLLIVTGPPGAGKSTVAAQLVASKTTSVLVEGDRFHGFLATGVIPPWLPESNEQNQVVVEASALATGRFVRGGYFTLFDGMIGPWFLPTFVEAALLDGADIVDYVVLMPTVEQCVDHVRTRVGHNFTDEAATRKMHHEFAAAPLDPRHVVVPGDASAADVVAEIQDRLDRGALRVD
jgi:predicted ABC-type ATPase